MMTEAPPAPSAALKDYGPRFDPLPASGPQIMTIVAWDFLPKHEFKDPTTGTIKVADAVEPYYGTQIDGKTYFVRGRPMTYSLNEKANYLKIYTAATGKAPVPGSTPKDTLGKGVTVDVELTDKVSKKGKPYKSTKIKAVTPVHPKLQGEVVPLKTLAPLLEEALKKEEKDDGYVPF